MSAFLCSTRHINALATFAMDQRLRVRLNSGQTLEAYTDAQRVADILLAGNIASLRHRYPDDDEFRPDYAITWQASAPLDLDAVVIFKQAQCFNYQSCEPDNYEQSDCAAIVRDIMRAAIERMPGYEAAPWGLDGDAPLPKVEKRPQPAQRDLLAMVFPNGWESVGTSTEDDDTPAAARPAPTPAPAPKPAPKPSKPAKPADDLGPF